MSATVLAGHEWHQSCVSRWLRCGLSFRYRYVDRLPVDHSVRGFAGPRGTASHAAAAMILAARPVERTELADPASCTLRERMLDAFEADLARGRRGGATYDDDTVGAAMDALEGEDLERMRRLALDPRLEAVEWRGIEQPYAIETSGADEHGHQWTRKWSGTIDACGVATRYVASWGMDGRESVDLHPGDHVLVDWKSGTETPLGGAERRLNTQLAIYALALSSTTGVAPERWRCFLGQTRDLDSPAHPKDDHGDTIPRELRRINPAFAAADVVVADAARGISPEDSKRKPRDAAKASIPKWIDEPNPAWEAAQGAPKGPLFRECLLDWPRVLATIQDTVRAAEAGLFPASGAASGQCRWCDYRGVCAAGSGDIEVHS